jgi:hypothetical protein
MSDVKVLDRRGVELNVGDKVRHIESRYHSPSKEWTGVVLDLGVYDGIPSVKLSNMDDGWSHSTRFEKVAP